MSGWGWPVRITLGVVGLLMLLSNCQSDDTTTVTCTQYVYTTTCTSD
jgi:hypothetical protein